MNKEEIENRIKELKNYTQEVWTDNELLQHDMRILSLEKMLLQQENIQLKEKINKAIELLQNSQMLFGRTGGKSLFMKVIEEEIEILKGDNNAGNN